MASQKVRHDWATNRTKSHSSEKNSLFCIISHILLCGQVLCFSKYIVLFIKTRLYYVYIFILLLLVSHPTVSDPLQPQVLQHARSPCPQLSPKVCPNSCPLHWWCHSAISSSDALFSFCPQSLPVSETFPVSRLFSSDDQNTGVSASESIVQMSQLFTSSGQSIGVSASTSVLPKNTQDWSTLGWTGWISLQSKGLSGVFSDTIYIYTYICCILSPCLFNLYAEYIVRNAGLKEAQAGIKITGRNINTSDMQMTPPLWQKVKKN